MTLRVTVTDIETGDSDSATVVEGDYLLICHAPCYEHGVQVYPGSGTHVITIKGHRPKSSVSGETASSAGTDPTSARGVEPVRPTSAPLAGPSSTTGEVPPTSPVVGSARPVSPDPSADGSGQ